LQREPVTVPSFVNAMRFAQAAPDLIQINVTDRRCGRLRMFRVSLTYGPPGTPLSLGGPFSISGFD
jgi:hypothetical protein